MSEIVDTAVGSFRRVTDGATHWWLWECPACQEMQPFDFDNSEHYACTKCGRVEDRGLGRNLVAHMQSRRLVGQEPTHDEGKPHRQISNGADGR